MKGMAADGMLNMKGNDNKQYMDFTKGGEKSAFGVMANNQYTALNAEFGYEAMIKSYNAYSPQYAKDFSFRQFNSLAQSGQDPYGIGVVSDLGNFFQGEIVNGRDSNLRTTTENGLYGTNKIVRAANSTYSDYSSGKLGAGIKGQGIGTLGPTIADGNNQKINIDGDNGISKDNRTEESFKRAGSGSFKF